MSEYYPGWRMRIYHNVTTDQADQAQYLCDLVCKNPSLDLCDVRTVPELIKHEVKVLNRIFQMRLKWKIYT